MYHNPVRSCGEKDLQDNGRRDLDEEIFVPAYVITIQTGNLPKALTWSLALSYLRQTAQI